jgi:HK97 family phage portal protein
MQNSTTMAWSLSSMGGLIKGLNPFAPSTPSNLRSERTYTLSELKNWEMFGDFSSDTSSGATVNSTTALSFSAVYSCVNVISETVASLPFNRLRMDGKGNKAISDGLPIDYLFLTQPNPFQTWFDFKYHLVKESLCNGNGYALIIRDDFEKPIRLEPLSSNEVAPHYVRDGRNHYLYYYVHGIQTRKEDLIHIKCLGSNGVVGYSPITIAREAIGAGLSQQEFTGSFYKNGMNIKGALEHPATLSEPAQERLRASMDKFKGARNGNGTIVLEEGLTYKGISITQQDAEFLGSRHLAVEEIARFYRVPLHKIGELSKSTNNNIEHQGLEFYTDTMVPWLERIEQEFDSKLNIGVDRLVVKHEFDPRKLLRADSKSRGEYLRVLFNLGAKTPNEIRQIEGDDIMDNPAMNKTYLQLNMSDIETLEDNKKKIKDVKN